MPEDALWEARSSEGINRALNILIDDDDESVRREIQREEEVEEEEEIEWISQDQRDIIAQSQNHWFPI